MYLKNYDLLMKLEPAFFRNKAFQTGLITAEDKEELASLGGGKTIHNEKLLVMGERPGGRETFILLVKTVRLFGDKYDKQCKDLESVLSVVA